MDPIFANRINGIIKARLEGLKALLKESSQVDHASTKGRLRERYLTEFLRSVLPPGHTVVGGFICDVLGNITPQLDLIIADASTIPTIAFTREVALVPVEVALVAVEVKSSLQSKHLKQLQTQAEAIRFLRPIAEGETSGSHNILLFVFAFESEVSEASLNEWLQEIPELFGVCVFGSLFIRRGPSGITTRSGDAWKETLVFVSSLLDAIIKVKERRPPQSLNIWRRYVVGVDQTMTVEGA